MLNKSAVFSIVALALAGGANAQSILAPKPATPAPPPPAAPGGPAIVVTPESALAAKLKPAAASAAASAPTQANSKAVATGSASATAASAAAGAGASAVPAQQNAPRPQIVVLSAAGSIEAQSGAVTISELASNQARALATASAKKTMPALPASPVIPARPIAQVPELVASAAPIAPVMNADIKLRKVAPKTPPRPYLASVIGLRGQELADFQQGDGPGQTLKAGDSIGAWSITKIVDGKLFMVSTTAAQKSRKSEVKHRVLSVGDVL